MSHRSDLFLHHAHLPWMVDATTMAVTPSELDALPWTVAFEESEALEAGAIANIDESRQVGHTWLRDPSRAPSIPQATAIGDALEATRALAEAVREGHATTERGQRFTDVLHIGIGGSQLGPFLLIDALALDAEGQPKGLPIHFFDNVDPDGIARTLGQLGDRLESTLVVVVTKSGSTPEPMNGLALVERAMRARALRPGDHLVGITVEGSKLDQRAQRDNWRAVLPIWPWVGGRYSVTSAVGLLPAELAGLDTESFLAGAAAMDDWTRKQDWRNNPAALLAGLWHVAGGGRGERNMVMLPYADRLVTLSRYLQQLVMESLGKALDRQGNPVHQGLTVYGNKGSTDQHAYVQQLRDGRDDFFVGFLQVLASGAPDPELESGIGAGDYLQGFLLGTRRALDEGGRRSFTITMPRVDAYAVGGLIALFERAVCLYASLIDINAFHQPGVEAGKRAAREVLDLSLAVRDALAKAPHTLDALGSHLDADPLELLYVLMRLELTGRVTRSGGRLDGSWQLP